MSRPASARARDRLARRTARKHADPAGRVREGGRVVQLDTGRLGEVLTIVGRVADVDWEDGQVSAHVLESLTPAL